MANAASFFATAVSLSPALHNFSTAVPQTDCGNLEAASPKLQPSVCNDISII
jgi:hypothetical protein